MRRKKHAVPFNNLLLFYIQTPKCSATLWNSRFCLVPTKAYRGHLSKGKQIKNSE
jgi:hypothetical protein